MEGSYAHRKMIDSYNKIKNNIYRGKYLHYNAKYTDSWCDIFVTTTFMKAGYVSLIGYECGCENHITLMNMRGSWVESDSYIPGAGDIILYDWNDTGIGNCTGWADHIGIVAKVANNGMMTVIEGNKNDRVETRQIKINSQFIRGYGVPKYNTLS